MSDRDEIPSPVEFLLENGADEQAQTAQESPIQQQTEVPPIYIPTALNLESNHEDSLHHSEMPPHSSSTSIQNTEDSPTFEFPSFATNADQSFDIIQKNEDLTSSLQKQEADDSASLFSNPFSNIHNSSFPSLSIEKIPLSVDDSQTANTIQVNYSTTQPPIDILSETAVSGEPTTPRKKTITKSSSFVHEILHEGDTDAFVSYGSDTENTLSHTENFAVSATSPELVVPYTVYNTSPLKQEGQNQKTDSPNDLTSSLFSSPLMSKEVASILLDKPIVDSSSIPHTQVELPHIEMELPHTQVELPVEDEEQNKDTNASNEHQPVGIELMDVDVSSSNPEQDISLESSVTIPQFETINIEEPVKKKKKKKKKPSKEKHEQGKLKVKQKNPIGVFIKLFLGDRSYIYVFLTILAVVSGILTYLIDMLIKYAQLGRTKLVELGGGNYIAEISILSTFNAIFVGGAAVLVWQVPPAEGGGLAALKAILNGSQLTGPLEFKTLVVKLMTIPMVLIAGLNVGKLGPSIHYVTMIGISMAKMPFFRKINESKYLRDQLIACGCAIGLGAVHITPLAGVLLGIEIIGTYFPFRAYIKSFYGALVAGITYSVLQSSFNQSWFFIQTWRSNFVFPAYTIPEILLFATIGLVMGCFGPIIIFAFEYFTIIRESFGRRLLIFKFPKLQNKWFSIFFQNIFYFIIFVAVITSILQYPKTLGSFMSGGLGKSLEDLAMTGPMTKQNGANASDWMDPDDPTKVLRNVAAFFFLKMILALCSIWLPLPGGALLPSMVIGAASGRLLGETIVYFNGGKYVSNTLNPGGLALVAAASLGVAVSHAFSTVFLCLEAFGISYHLPCMIGALAALRVSSTLSISIYEVTIKLRKWNALLEMKTDNVDNNVATKKLMQPVSSMIVLTKIMSLKQIITILEDKMHHDVKEFAVVQNMENMILLGYQTRTELDSMCKTLLEKGTDLNEEFYIYCKVCPCLLSEDTALITIHKMFSMLLLEYGYVVENGKLIGQVTRSDLRAYADRHRTVFTIINSRLKQVRGMLKNL